MKRQSKAEKAIQHQIDIIQQEVKTLHDEINHRQSQIVALTKIIESMLFQIEASKV